MGMQAGGGGGLQSEINVTPMVDIMLVLLIIFMVVTPFLQHGIKVAIPDDLKNPEDDRAINLKTSGIMSNPNDNEYYMAVDNGSRDNLKATVEKTLAKKNEEAKIV